MLVVAFLCSLLLYLYNMVEALHIFPESIAAIIIGIGIGIFFKVAYGKHGMVDFLEFEPHTFFLILLPPIMFQAGFNLDMGTFLRNIKTINMYAIFATLIASFVFGIIFYYGSMLTPFRFAFLNSLHFGCFISAIDPVATISIFNSLHVNEKIYMIVFGESTLNDAVAIALSDSVSHINEQVMQGKLPDFRIAALYALGNFLIFFLGSLLLGILISVVVSWLFKRFDFHTYTWIEVGIFGMFTYLPYIVAEYLELSGILAIFVAGLCLRDW
jgi:solute carrier family 9 (sodium/hydrogen exchanger), member 8